VRACGRGLFVRVCGCFCVHNSGVITLVCNVTVYPVYRRRGEYEIYETELDFNVNV